MSIVVSPCPLMVDPNLSLSEGTLGIMQRRVSTMSKIDILTQQFFSEKGLPFISGIDKGGLLPPFTRFSGVISMAPTEPVSLVGLRGNRLSGSAQFTESSLETLIKRIRDVEGKDVPILILDLMQENHLHVRPKKGKGALAFSFLHPLAQWMGPIRSAQQIAQSERAQAEELSRQSFLEMYMIVDSLDPKTLTKDNHTVTGQITLEPREVFTEEQLVVQKGCSYARLPDRKFGHMEWRDIDSLITLAKTVPPGTHIHPHCRRGLTRTTLILSMLDMFKNAHQVAPDDIIKRQGPAVLGGVDLFHLPDPTSWDYSFKSGYVPLLHHFHQYVLENRDTQFQKSWSNWAHEKGLEEPPMIILESSSTMPSLESTLPDPEEIDFRREKPLVLTGLNDSKISISNLRTTQGLYLDLQANPHFKPDGLSEIKASGSSQYSENSFKQFMKDIKARDPLAEVFLWDLQHYDHVLVNGMDVSLLETNAEFISDRTAEEIKLSEVRLKRSILQERGVRLRAIDTLYPKDEYHERFSYDVRPERVETPEEFITRAGAHYILIPTKRFSEISDDTEVDRLVDHVRTKSEHVWDHFHCKMGKSRTTLYLAMNDILYNADKLSMKDIVKRQHLMGGIDLFDVTPLDQTWAYEKQGKIDRVVFLARFHEYAKTVFLPAKIAHAVPQSWSDWSRVNIGFQPTVNHLVLDTSAPRE